MALDQAAIETVVEKAANRVLMHTVAAIAFRAAGLTPDQTRDIGRSLATEASKLEVVGATAEDQAAVDAAYNAALIQAFDRIAELLEHGDNALAGS